MDNLNLTILVCNICWLICHETFWEKKAQHILELTSLKQLQSVNVALTPSPPLLPVCMVYHFPRQQRFQPCHLSQGPSGKTHPEGTWRLLIGWPDGKPSTIGWRLKVIQLFQRKSLSLQELVLYVVLVLANQQYLRGIAKKMEATTSMSWQSDEFVKHKSWDKRHVLKHLLVTCLQI